MTNKNAQYAALTAFSAAERYHIWGLKASYEANIAARSGRHDEAKALRLEEARLNKRRDQWSDIGCRMAQKLEGVLKGGSRKAPALFSFLFLHRLHSPSYCTVDHRRVCGSAHAGKVLAEDIALL